MRYYRNTDDPCFIYKVYEITESAIYYNSFDLIRKTQQYGLEAPLEVLDNLLTRKKIEIITEKEYKITRLLYG